MLRFLLFVCLVWTSAGRAVAQDWATVRVGDTAWFMGGPKPTLGGNSYCESNAEFRLLRILFVDSARALGGDSVFFFPRGLRGEFDGGCVDTAAASWAGYSTMRKPGGKEYYFNSVADTITVMTQASMGSWWLLARDTSGRSFRATISAVGLDIVSGSLDSIKTASIQAYTGNTPVSHPYNTRVLRWSKQHGWIDPLDFFLFPNYPSSSPGLGSSSDSSQMGRLEWAAIASGLKKVDLISKYSPGNEWIWVQKYGLIFDDITRTTTHDSVIAFQLLDSTRGLATLHTTKVVWQRHAPTGPPYQPYTTTTLSVSTHTDTVHAAFAYGTFDYPSLPEVKTFAHLMANTGKIKQDLVQPKHGLTPICGGYLFSQGRGSGMIPFMSGCWRHMSHPDDWPVCRTLLAGFGLMHTVAPTSLQGYFQQGKMHYLKLANCTIGTKFDVAALSVNSPLEQWSSEEVVLVPNPATASAQLYNLPSGQYQINLRDATGRTLQYFQTSGPAAEIPTASLPSGVYFVEISNTTGRKTLKLQVLH